MEKQVTCFNNWLPLFTSSSYPSIVLVQPRKTRPCLTERLLMVHKESNQTNKHHRLRRRDTKESTCLLRHITTERSGLCQYIVCIALNTMLKK